MDRRTLASLLAVTALIVVAGSAAEATGPATTLSPATLGEQLKRAAAQSDGEVAVSVVHLETGATAGVAADKPLPLFSVYKLPLAVAVLKEVETGRLRLDQTVQVTPADVTPGVGANAERWKAVPADFT
ncbi:MAG TPA: serine hydrolase, partial [Polyangia bacterium]